MSNAPQFNRYDGAAVRLAGSDYLQLCAGSNAGGSYYVQADIAPNFSCYLDAQVPDWSLNSLNMAIICDRQTFSYRWPSASNMQICNGSGVPLQSFTLSPPLSNAPAWNSLRLVSQDSNLVMGVNGQGYVGTVPNWPDVQNDWKNGSFAWSASNSASVAGSNLLRNLHLQSTTTFSDPVRFACGVTAKTLNAEKLGAGSLRAGSVTASNISASNLGTAAFRNTIPWSMVTDAPAAWSSNSNGSSMTATYIAGGGVAPGGVFRTVRLDDRLGIGKDPLFPLDVQGVACADSLATSNVTVYGCNAVQLGSGVTGRQVDAGKIGYGLFSQQLDIIGAGATGSTRGVRVWDQLVVGSGAVASDTLTVNGSAKCTGNVSCSANVSVTNLASAADLRLRPTSGTTSTVYLNDGGQATDTGTVQFVNSGHFITCSSTAGYLGISGPSHTGHRIYHKSGSHNFSGQAQMNNGLTVNGGLAVNGGLTVSGASFKGMYAGTHAVGQGVDGMNQYVVTHNLNLTGNQFINCQVQDLVTPAVSDCFTTKILAVSANSFTVGAYRQDSQGGWWNRSWTLSWTILLT